MIVINNKTYQQAKGAIVKGDYVFHALSKLWFRCENSKHERWMNENKYYLKLKTV